MKVKQEDVRYLIFEGGGGKGATYLGALQALEDLDVLSYHTKNINGREVLRLDSNKIKGVGGTSVGSLTALLVAAGYTAQEIQDVLMSNLTDRFLDTIDFGIIPTVLTSEDQKYYTTDPRWKEENFTNLKWGNFIDKEEKSIKDILTVPIKFIKQTNFYFFSLLLKWYLYYESKKNDEEDTDEDISLIPTPKDLARSRTLKNAIDKILDKPFHSFNSLKYEFGFFLGAGFREVIDDLIERKSGIKNCTFKQFCKEFNIDLVVTAFDLNTKKVVYFRNNKQWSNLCVADAVRMSISIPLVFKPVAMRIEKNKIKPLEDDLASAHYFVDGGVANNFPLHTFDKSETSTLNPNVLGFTLSYAKIANPFIEQVTFFEYLEDVFLS
ncbi:MAG: patatin-like phospholipase family protein, partial [Candidatus Heimdallarchaeaceae archaeon]